MSGSTRRIGRSRLSLIAIAVAAGALLAVPAQGQALFRFGSALDPTVQPSNSGGPDGHECDQPNPENVCTWIMNEAYGRPDGGERAPRRGVIRKIRLIAGGPGHFRLQIARAHELANGDFEGKVVRKGPVINYLGQTNDPDPNDDNYVLESFPVRVKIFKGERLAIKTANTSALRCSSGGPNTLLFEPPLLAGGGFKASTDDEGCWLLMEAVVRKRHRHRR